MEDRDVYAAIAAILPPMLGLGLIELYIERAVNIATIAAALIGLALVMIVMAALRDVAHAAREPRGRRRRIRIDR